MSQKALSYGDGQRSLMGTPWGRLRLRLGLLSRGFRANWAIFVENKLGLIGLGIISLFALMTLVYPILISTLWDAKTYDPIVGYDFRIVAHPAPPSPAGA